MGFLTAFFFVPLAVMALRSINDPSPANYSVVFESDLYARVLWTTLRTASIVTLTCLLLGYPYAYVMHHSGRLAKAVLVAFVLLPFWSSLLVRTYAWSVLLRDTGVINSILIDAGVIDSPLALMRNTLGVTIGMSHVLLPFMVLPIYAVMRRIDPDVVPAAESLGARPIVAFRKAFLPLSMPGVLAGSLLVFVIAIGFYITPAVLGSPQNAMFSELVVSQVSVLLDFGVGSALAMVLLIVTLAVLWAGSRFVHIKQSLGYDAE